MLATLWRRLFPARHGGPALIPRRPPPPPPPPLMTPLRPPPPPPPAPATPRPKARARFFLDDGSEANVAGDPELARRLSYLAENIVPPHSDS